MTSSEATLNNPKRLIQEIAKKAMNQESDEHQSDESDSQEKSEEVDDSGGEEAEGSDVHIDENEKENEENLTTSLNKRRMRKI